MGCDIHFHAEVKIDGQWHHYTTRSIDRNYKLFTKLAGVRNYWEGEITPLSQPKGLPDDATFLTRYDSDEWGDDGHSHSWIGAVEIAELAVWVKDNPNPGTHSRYEYDLFGYLFGNDWSGFVKYPEDRPKGLEDIRFVFWFDN